MLSPARPFLICAAFYHHRLPLSLSSSRRSCCALAQSYPQLSRDLFNAAFVSCWSELDKDHQSELLDAVRLALRSQEIPEITQTLLNLAEFMEHCDIVSRLARQGRDRLVC